MSEESKTGVECKEERLPCKIDVLHNVMDIIKNNSSSSLVAAHKFDLASLESSNALKVYKEKLQAHKQLMKSDKLQKKKSELKQIRVEYKELLDDDEYRTAHKALEIAKAEKKAKEQAIQNLISSIKIDYPTLNDFEYETNAVNHRVAVMISMPLFDLYHRYHVSEKPLQERRGDVLNIIRHHKDFADIAKNKENRDEALMKKFHRDFNEKPKRLLKKLAVRCYKNDKNDDEDSDESDEDSDKSDEEDEQAEVEVEGGKADVVGEDNDGDDDGEDEENDGEDEQEGIEDGVEVGEAKDGEDIEDGLEAGEAKDGEDREDVNESSFLNDSLDESDIQILQILDAHDDYGVDQSDNTFDVSGFTTDEIAKFRRLERDMGREDFVTYMKSIRRKKRGIDANHEGKRFGRVYMVVGQCQPIVKIGGSHFKDLDDSFVNRVRNMLGNAVVVLMWDCEYDNRFLLEKAIHRKLDEFRVWKDLEFFELYTKRGKTICNLVNHYREVITKMVKANPVDQFMYTEGIKKSRLRVNLGPLPTEVLNRVQGSIVYQAGCRNFKLHNDDVVLHKEIDNVADAMFDIHDLKLYCALMKLQLLQPGSDEKSKVELVTPNNTSSAKKRKISHEKPGSASTALASISTNLASVSTSTSTLDFTDNNTRRQPRDQFENLVSNVDTPSAQSRSVKKSSVQSNQAEAVKKPYVMQIRENDCFLSYRLKNKVSDSWESSEDLWHISDATYIRNGIDYEFGRVVYTGERVVRSLNTEDVIDLTDGDTGEGVSKLHILKHPFIIGRARKNLGNITWGVEYTVADCNAIEKKEMISDNVVMSGIFNDLQGLCPYRIIYSHPQHKSYKWGILSSHFMQEVFRDRESDFVWTESFLARFKQIVEYHFVIIPVCSKSHWFDILLVNPNAVKLEPTTILGRTMPFLMYFDSVNRGPYPPYCSQAAVGAMVYFSSFWNSMVYYIDTKGKSSTVSEFSTSPLHIMHFQTDDVVTEQDGLYCGYHTIRNCKMLMHLIHDGDQAIFSTIDAFETVVRKYQADEGSKASVECFRVKLLAHWESKVLHEEAKATTECSNANTDDVCKAHDDGDDDDGDDDDGDDDDGDDDDGGAAAQKQEVMALLKSFFHIESSRVKSDKHREPGERKDSQTYWNELHQRLHRKKRIRTQEEIEEARKEDQLYLEEVKEHVRKQTEYFSKSECMLNKVVNVFPRHCHERNNRFLLDWGFYDSKEYIKPIKLRLMIRNDFIFGAWFKVDEDWSCFLSKLSVKFQELRNTMPTILFRTIGPNKQQWQIRVLVNSQDIAHDIKVNSNPACSPCTTPIVTVTKFLPYTYRGGVLALHALCYLFGGKLQVSLEIACSKKGHLADNLPDMSPNWDDYIEYNLALSLNWQYRKVDKTLSFIIDPETKTRKVCVVEHAVSQAKKCPVPQAQPVKKKHSSEVVQKANAKKQRIS